jgi:hypothetical protein
MRFERGKRLASSISKRSILLKVCLLVVTIHFTFTLWMHESQSDKKQHDFADGTNVGSYIINSVPEKRTIFGDVWNRLRGQPKQNANIALSGMPWKKDWKSYKKVDQCLSEFPRNYLEVPILIVAPTLLSKLGPEACDVPCFSTPEVSPRMDIRGDAFISSDLEIGGDVKFTAPCAHQRTVSLSMEPVYKRKQNEIPKNAAMRRDLLMTVQLKSNVTAGYYSWPEYDIMAPVDYERKKQTEAHGAAYISNCQGPSGRLKVLQELMNNGVKIDSFGKCMKNKELADGSRKDDSLKDYKFGMAFENSRWQDYASEKLFQVYAAGGIPVVIGAPNSHDFEPLPETMLFEKDFKNVEELSKRIHEIANNDTLFWHYLRYKTQRPSDKFLALYDISAAHSRCRLCVKMADLMDEEYGEYDYNGNYLPRSNLKGLTLRVRERNKYFFQDVHIEKMTYQGLLNAIMSAFKDVDHQPIWRNIRPAILDTAEYKIYRVYKFHPRQTMWDTLHNEEVLINSDKAVKNLKQNERIEVILV